MKPDPWTPPDLQQLIDAHPRHHRLITEAYWAGVRHNRPYIAVDPAMRSGQPCLNGTRLTVEAVVGLVWAGETVATVADEYDITRADVLVPCWYAGVVGLPGRRGLHPTRSWRDRWGAWAAQVHDALWSTSALDVDAVPDPPARDDQPAMSGVPGISPSR